MRTLFARLFLVVTLVLASVNGFAAVSIIGTPTATLWNDSTSTKTISVDATGANGIIVVIGWKDPGDTVTMTSVTYNAVSLTHRGLYAAGYHNRSDVFYLASPASGTHNLVVTSNTAMSTTGSEGEIYVYLVSGADTTTLVSATETQQDVASPFTTMSSTLTTAVGDMILDMGQISADSASVTSFTANGGQTTVTTSQPTTNGSTFSGSYKAASTTSTSTGWTYAPSASFNAIYRAIIVKASTASGTTVTPSTATFAFTGATPTVTATANKFATPSTATFAFTGATPTITRQTFTWYILPTPGSYDSNSILAGQTYPTGSWLRVVTDFAHITANYATGPLQNDINDYSTAESGYTGTDSATYEIKTPSLTTSQYTITANIAGSISLGPSTASLSFTGATPSVSIGNRYTPTLASLGFTGATPTVTITNNLLVSPAAAQPRFSGAAPNVLINGQPIGGSNNRMIHPNIHPNIRPNFRRAIP